jgi:hypothetical protein
MSIKEKLYSSCCEMSSKSAKDLFDYGANHPLQTVAGASFLCFSLIPILFFLGFVFGTVLVTIMVAVVWESFLITCGIMGLTVALTITVTMAGCCTGLATLIYFTILVVQSPLKWLAHRQSPPPSKFIKFDEGSSTIEKED